MNWFQVFAWFATGAGVVVTAMKFRSELILGRQERAEEVRWKRAQEGKELDDEMIEKSRWVEAARWSSQRPGSGPRQIAALRCP